MPDLQIIPSAAHSPHGTSMSITGEPLAEVLLSLTLFPSAKINLQYFLKLTFKKCSQKKCTGIHLSIIGQARGSFCQEPGPMQGSCSRTSWIVEENEGSILQGSDSVVLEKMVDTHMLQQGVFRRTSSWIVCSWFWLLREI